MSTQVYSVQIGDVVGGGGAQYHAFWGSANNQSLTIGVVEIPISVPGNLTKLAAFFDTNGLGVDTGTIDLMVNGTATGTATLVLNSGSASGANWTGTDALAIGDRVALRLVVTGTGTLFNLRLYAESTPEIDNEFMLMGNADIGFPTTGTNYLGLMTSQLQTGTATEANADQLNPGYGWIDMLYVNRENNVAGGASVDYTARQDRADSSLAVTIGAGASTGNTATSFTVTTATWSVTTHKATITIGAHSLTRGTEISFTGIVSTGAATGYSYNGTFNIDDVAATTVDVYIENDPGTYSSGGTGRTSAADWWTPGEKAGLEGAVTAGTDAASGVGWSCRWRPWTPEQQIIMGRTSSPGTADAELLIETGEDDGGTAQTLTPLRNLTAKNMWVELTAAPGAGKTRTLALQVGSTDTAVTVTVSGTDTTGNSEPDPTATAAAINAAFAPGTLKHESISSSTPMRLQSTSTGTPAVTDVLWGVTFCPAKPSPTVAKNTSATLYGDDGFNCSVAITSNSGNSRDQMLPRWEVTTETGSAVLTEGATVTHPDYGAAFSWVRDWTDLGNMMGCFGPTFGAKLTNSAVGRDKVACRVYDPLSTWSDEDSVTVADSVTGSADHTFIKRDDTNTKWWRVGAGGNASKTGSGIESDRWYVVDLAQLHADADFTSGSNLRHDVLMDGGETHDITGITVNAAKNTTYHGTSNASRAVLDNANDTNPNPFNIQGVDNLTLENLTFQSQVAIGSSNGGLMRSQATVDNLLIINCTVLFDGATGFREAFQGGVASATLINFRHEGGRNIVMNPMRNLAAFGGYIGRSNTSQVAWRFLATGGPWEDVTIQAYTFDGSTGNDPLRMQSMDFAYLGQTKVTSSSFSLAFGQTATAGQAVDVRVEGVLIANGSTAFQMSNVANVTINSCIQLGTVAMINTTLGNTGLDRFATLNGLNFTRRIDAAGDDNIRPLNSGTTWSLNFRFNNNLIVADSTITATDPLYDSSTAGQNHYLRQFKGNIFHDDLAAGGTVANRVGESPALLLKTNATAFADSTTNPVMVNGRGDITYSAIDGDDFTSVNRFHVTSGDGATLVLTDPYAIIDYYGNWRARTSQVGAVTANPATDAAAVSGTGMLLTDCG